jgi:lysozyme family protein
MAGVLSRDAFGDMSESRFDACLAVVLEHEGGFVDDPEDPGGATKYGVSLRAFVALYPTATVQSIRDLTVEDAADFYHSEYWDLCQCNALSPGLDLAVFDCAVHQGARTARKLLQRALRVKADGYIGPITLGALLDADPAEVLLDFMARRAKRYTRTRGVKRFGRGWYRRLLDVYAAAMTCRMICSDALPQGE